jgi:hypothetical protein
MKRPRKNRNGPIRAVRRLKTLHEATSFDSEALTRAVNRSQFVLTPLTDRIVATQQATADRFLKLGQRQGDGLELDARVVAIFHRSSARGAKSMRAVVLIGALRDRRLDSPRPPGSRDRESNSSISAQRDVALQRRCD